MENVPASGHKIKNAIIKYINQEIKENKDGQQTLSRWQIVNVIKESLIMFLVWAFLKFSFALFIYNAGGFSLSTGQSSLLFHVAY